MSIISKTPAELGDCGCFSRTIYSNQQNNEWAWLELERGWRIQPCTEFLLQKELQFTRPGYAPGADNVSESAYNGLGRFDTQVCLDKQGLQLVPGFRTNFTRPN
jgi:hypothetical protein